VAALSLAQAGCADHGGEASEGEVEPGEWLPGGDTTNTLLLGENAFTRPADNISEEHELAFYSGNSFFNQSWVQAPSSTDARDGLGPLFNARSCAACHFKDGRGSPPLPDDEERLGLLMRLSVAGEGPEGAPVPVPDYGGQLQPFSISGVAPEGALGIDYDEESGSYDDGDEYELLVPRYRIVDPAYGDFPEASLMSPRVAQQVIGLGLIEAISEERLEALADPEDRDGDGISGRLQRVPDAETGELVIGRFGWKAEQPSVRQQAAGAFLGDMGITTSVFPQQDCTEAEAACQAAIAGGDPEIADDLLDKVALYARLLAVPVRSAWDDPEVLRGKSLFSDAGCPGCHVARHETSENAELPETADQVIFPYTDLLLHDMGEGLADDRPSFAADGREWRTPPLWGIGRIPDVNDHDRLLHDGRARGVAEAILWHGGEAEAARTKFVSMSRKDREALLRFVESL
jgi:CxxC motif-containing protein (DUF1111 family)